MPSLASLTTLALLALLATLVVGEEVILLTGGYNGTNYLSGNEVTPLLWWLNHPKRKEMRSVP